MNATTPHKITNEEFASIHAGTINLTLALCFIMGWQGGTVHQVSAALQVSLNDILEADDEKAGQLCRKAQALYWKEHKGDINMLLLERLTIVVQQVKGDYEGHLTPGWLDRAQAVIKIMKEIIFP